VGQITDRAELLDFYRRRVEAVPCEKKIEAIVVRLAPPKNFEEIFKPLRRLRGECGEERRAVAAQGRSAPGEEVSPLRAGDPKLHVCKVQKELVERV